MPALLREALIGCENFTEAVVLAVLENFKSCLTAHVYDLICFLDLFSFSFDHRCSCFFTLLQLGLNLSVQLLTLLYIVKCCLESPLELEGLGSLVSIIGCSQLGFNLLSSLLLGLMVRLYLFIICFDQLSYFTSSGALCLLLLLCLFCSFCFPLLNFGSELLCFLSLGLFYPFFKFFLVLHHVLGKQFAFSMVLVNNFSSSLPTLELSVDPAELNGSRKVKPVSVCVEGGEFTIWH